MFVTSINSFYIIYLTYNGLFECLIFIMGMEIPIKLKIQLNSNQNYNFKYINILLSLL